MDTWGSNGNDLLKTLSSTKKTKVDKATTKKDKASTKDPGAPKRPPSAFFVFMEQFRKDFKENFPDNKLVAAVAKEGGVKWKSMSETVRSVNEIE